MITSAANPRVKLLRSLGDRKRRRAEGLCLVEGIRLLEEALRSDARVGPIVYSPERLSATAAGRAMRQRLERLPVAEEIDERVLEGLSETMTSQGVVAAVSVPASRPIPDQGLVLILDGIADPGNAGSILRSAGAAGVVAAIATQASTDLWSPKALRAGMGAHFHLNVLVDLPWRELPLAIGQRPLLLADAAAGRPYWELDWSQPLALVIGSEAHGAAGAASEAASSSVSIPMEPGVESLNAAAAAAVLLFEARRARADGHGRELDVRRGT